MRRLEAGGDGLWSVRRTIRTGKAELLTHFPASELERVAVDEKHLEVLHRINPRSVITVPLVARGRALAATTCCTAAAASAPMKRLSSRCTCPCAASAPKAQPEIATTRISSGASENSER